MTDTPELKRQLERLREQDYDAYTENYFGTIEEYCRQMVEDGTMTPKVYVTAEVSLSLTERLTGTRKQDMTAMLATGIMLGAALERDVPMGSDAEDEWRDSGLDFDAE